MNEIEKNWKHPIKQVRWVDNEASSVEAVVEKVGVVVSEKLLLPGYIHQIKQIGYHPNKHREGATMRLIV